MTFSLPIIVARSTPSACCALYVDGEKYCIIIVHMTKQSDLLSLCLRVRLVQQVKSGKPSFAAIWISQCTNRVLEDGHCVVVIVEWAARVGHLD